MTCISVTQLNRYVASLLDSDRNLNDVDVSGEISSLKKYNSGHVYFNLKDKESSVSCVMFRSRITASMKIPEDGQKVIVRARASLYDRDGKFQLYVNELIHDGIGDLFAEFEKLKKKLEAEGIFDESRKRTVPYLPRKIGVASSPSGAVIRDIINVLGRRFPGFSMQLIPVKVQGDGAAKSIISALEIFNTRKETDVIIIARGGGSMEDLWCFNDESLARAVAASVIPVISAVGHETDFTLCDFAADLRAPTPSAAAELAVPDKQGLYERLGSYKKSLDYSMTSKVQYSRMRLQSVLSGSIMTKPASIWSSRYELVIKYSEALNITMKKIIDDKKRDTVVTITSLDSLSPLKVLSRGYAAVSNTERGINVRSINDVRCGENLLLQLSDGRIHCLTQEIEPEGV